MRYIIKIWLLTIIASPLLLAFILGIIVNESSSDEILNSYEIIFLMTAIGLVLSIPAMIIFWVIKRNFNSTFPSRKKKLILSIYSFLSVWATFYIVDRGFVTKWNDQTIWILIYSITK